MNDMVLAAAKRIFDVMPHHGLMGSARPVWVDGADTPRQQEAIRFAEAAFGEGSLPQTNVVPEGWQIVPKRLTARMMAAACKGLDTTASMNAAYELALEAAPKPRKTPNAKA